MNVLLILACLNVGAIVLYLSGAAGMARGHRRTGTALFVCGWIANLMLVTANAVVTGEPPLGNLYHVLVFLSLCFLPCSVMLALRHDLGWLRGTFALISAAALIGALFVDKNIQWRRVPALRSAWFVPHVASYMIGYALATMAAVMVVRALWAQWREAGTELDHPSAGKRMPGEFEAAAYHVMRLAFPFMTFGLLSGALWAEDAWGVYWSWDPKETWSLVTWTLYVVYFHCRARPPLRRYAAPAHLLAYAALLITFLVVNLLPRLGSVLHGYA